MRRLILGVLVLGACGGGSGGLTTDERELQGTWVLTGASADEAFTFTGAEYERDEISLLTDGTTGMQAEVGTYDAGGGVLTWMPMQWTCRGSDGSYAASYTVTATNLNLIVGSTITSFAKTTPTGGSSGTVRLGCFATDGTFTQQPLAPL